MLDVETVKQLMTDKKYLEFQHRLAHEQIIPSQTKVIVREIRNTDYIERLLKVKIAMLSSYTIQNIQDNLDLECIKHGFDAQIKYGQYNQYIQEMLDETSFLYEFKPDLIILALNTPTFLENVHVNCLNMSKQEIDEIVISKLNYLHSAISNMNKKLKARILITNLEIPSYSPYGIRDANCDEGIRYLVADFNHKLFLKTKDLGNVFIIDFEKIASYVGKKHLTDQKYYYLGKFYLSNEVIPYFSKELVKTISSVYGKSKKCLIVDLDNTLWGGVIGEDGPSGIQLGNDGLGLIYRDVQKIILNYYKNGVILAICSKNNYDDVLPVFNNQNMILKKENFTIIKTNWKDKSENIIDISKELNIGLDSIVFLDDNPLERGVVKNKLPSVHVIDFPEDISELPEMLKHITFFQFLELTDEDKKRNELYAMQNARIELQKNFNNVTDYLFDLKTTISVKENSFQDIDRITQLINKTNQFNLCTNRYTKEQVDEMMHSANSHIFSMNVWDKFGELGLTGVCIIQDDDSAHHITDFLMSCRIMSRGIEQEFLRQCLINLDKKQVIGKFISTAKNEPVKDFYKNMLFDIVSEEEKQTIYKFENQNQIKKVDWIEVK